MSIIESKLYATGTMRYITEIPMDGSGFQGMAIGGAVVINTGAITPTPNTGVISNITMPPLYDPGFIFTVLDAVNTNIILGQVLFLRITIQLIRLHRRLVS